MHIGVLELDMLYYESKAMPETGVLVCYAMAISPRDPVAKCKAVAKDGPNRTLSDSYSQSSA